MFNIYAFLIYTITISITPGPNNILCLAFGSKNGYKKALHYIFGVMIGFSTIIALSLFFNLILINLIPKIANYIKIIGFIYILYLAFQVSNIKRFFTKEKEKDEIESTNKDICNIKNGFFLQFINPKGIIYALTVTGSYIVPYFKESKQLLLFVLYFFIVAFFTTSTWALFGTIFNKVLSKYENAINIILSLLLIYTAIALVI